MRKIYNWMIDKWLAGFITAAIFFALKLYFDSSKAFQKDDAAPPKQTTSLLSGSTEHSIKKVAWKGKLNSKVNIFLHYQIEGEFLIGEITYLDTKNKTPIPIIGTMAEDEHVSLLEFSKDGNITGIISGTPGDQTFTGKWFSPKSKKELSLDLSRADTLMKTINTSTTTDNIPGDYHYQYSAAGRLGDLKIRKVSPTKISVDIFSATDEPARNMAIVEADTVAASTDFVYQLEPGKCEFRIRFFNEFAFINYTKGECRELFGHNASVDGIFYKQK